MHVIIFFLQTKSIKKMDGYVFDCNKTDDSENKQ